MQARVAAVIKVAAVAAALALAGCMGCKQGDPIVNPGNGGEAGSDSGFVPWWVEEQVPNSQGVIAK